MDFLLPISLLVLSLFPPEHNLFKRQWLLGKNFGYSTALEMFGDYFKSKIFELFNYNYHMFFLVPFLSLQISASGKLYNFLSNNFL